MPWNLSGDIPASVILSCFSTRIDYFRLGVHYLFIYKSMSNLEIGRLQINLLLCMNTLIPERSMSLEDIFVCLKLNRLNNLLNLLRNIAAVKELLVLGKVHLAILNRPNLLIMIPCFLSIEILP
jgi:hypothetical protein